MEMPFGFAAQAMPPDLQPYSESEFLSLLGDRVRAMRLLRDMSRRELSRRSRVSERYIAQIEAGKGNVSIVLLLRIAHAIRCG
jgi:DNA-binding XRE family transcriptional regulator